jgi:TrmH family RNA methyltransferase
LSERIARLVADPGHVRLEGLHAVKHALRFGAETALLLTTDKLATLALGDRMAPDLHDRLAAGLVEVGPDVLGEASGAGRFDVVGFARRPSPDSLDAVGAPAVLLEDPRNLGNLGAVVRVAAGFGARGVRTTGSVDPWHPTVVRAAAGLHFAISVARITEVGAARVGDGPLLALDPGGDDLRTVRISSDAVLAFGSERHGLSPQLRSRADQLLAIPMREQVSSYNLATSVAIALYHWAYSRSTTEGDAVEPG